MFGQNVFVEGNDITKQFAKSEFIDNVLRNGKFDADTTDEQKAEIIKAIIEHKLHKVILIRKQYIIKKGRTILL